MFTEMITITVVKFYLVRLAELQTKDVSKVKLNYFCICDWVLFIWKVEILLYFFLIFCRTISFLAWTKTVFFGQKQLLKIKKKYFSNYPLKELLFVQCLSCHNNSHIYGSWYYSFQGAFHFILIMTLWIMYHYLICSSRETGLIRVSMACQKQSYLYIISVLRLIFWF